MLVGEDLAYPRERARGILKPERELDSNRHAVELTLLRGSGLVPFQLEGPMYMSRTALRYGRADRFSIGRHSPWLGAGLIRG